MDQKELFSESCNNPTGFQAKDWGFRVGYSKKGLWALELIQRKDRVWNTERVIHFADPYSAALGARRAFERILHLAYGDEKINKAYEKFLLRDINLIIDERYYDFAFADEIPSLEVNREEEAFLAALVVPLEEAE